MIRRQRSTHPWLWLAVLAAAGLILWAGLRLAGSSGPLGTAPAHTPGAQP